MNDPVFGKAWTIDAEKSILSAEPPTSETRVYEEVGSGYKLSVAGARDGQSYSWGYTVGTDGTRSPVHGRSDVDCIEKHRVNDFITIGSFTKNGQIVASYRREVSPDGTALTVIASGCLQDGETYFDVIRYKPQQSQASDSQTA